MLILSGLAPESASVQRVRYTMKHKLNAKLATFGAAAIMGFSLLMTGCDRDVSKTEDVKVRDDGSVKSKETTVTEHPDGSVSKTEKKTDTKP
jgi:hypothetical protein